MRQQAQAEGTSEGQRSRPFWSDVLRALREARGATQEGWAALLGVSRKTVQRWEQSTAVPDPAAEAALVELCRQRGLFRAFDQGPLRGVMLTPDLLRDLLAEARIGVAVVPPAPALAPPPAARLTARASDGRVTAHPLGFSVTSIGRGPDNDIVIPSEHVSRYHARVTWTGQHYVIEDLGSKNMTFVDGQPLMAPHPLRTGEVVILAGRAEYALTFDAGDATVTVSGARLPGGGLWVDGRAGEVWLRGRPLRPSPPAFRILVALYERAGAAVDTATLARRALPEHPGDAATAVESLIDELRGLIDAGPDAPQVLCREPGGYRLMLT